MQQVKEVNYSEAAILKTTHVQTTHHVHKVDHDHYHVDVDGDGDVGDNKCDNNIDSDNNNIDSDNNNIDGDNNNIDGGDKFKSESRKKQCGIYMYLQQKIEKKK